jgi:hypothetical protein
VQPWLLNIEAVGLAVFVHRTRFRDSPTAQQLGRPVFTPARLNPAYDAVNRFSTTAGSNFNGATVTLNRQFKDNFELLAGYTHSKTIDDASSDLEQPQNPFDPVAERALTTGIFTIFTFRYSATAAHRSDPTLRFREDEGLALRSAHQERAE